MEGSHILKLNPLRISVRSTIIQTGAPTLELGQKSIITARNSSYGKVIFSQVCVISSVHEGGMASQHALQVT